MNNVRPSGSTVRFGVGGLPSPAGKQALNRETRTVCGSSLASLLIQSALIMGLMVLPAGCHSEPGEAGRSPAAQPAEVASTREPAEQPAESLPPFNQPLEDLVRIPGGPFIFGATEQQFQFFLTLSVFNFPGMVEKLRQLFVMPARSETTPEFFIDRFEVTNEHFWHFVLKTGYKPEEPTDFLKHWGEAKKPPEWSLTFPVVWVNQKDAQAFCQWRGGRLPTGEEWEKAARGTEAGYFPWGNQMPDKTTANFTNKQAEATGNRPGDVSPFEVFDMGGNVSEITSTRVPKGNDYGIVVKGGAFSGPARDMLCFNRIFIPENARRASVGIRCVADEPASKNQD